jgi:SH3 domain protein
MRRALLGLLLLAASATAAALEFRTVGAEAAVLYDAPSVQARKLFILSQYYPVEVIVTLDKWVKVRDASGALAWLESAKLGEKRCVLVTAAEADIRSQPDPASPLVFQAERDVALELLAVEGAWLKVKHRDGLSGYIAAKDVWGI